MYYFDNKDKILLTEMYGQSENITDREYYFYTEGEFESINFSGGTMKTVRNIDLLVLKDGRIIEVSNYGRVGISISN